MIEDIEPKQDEKVELGSIDDFNTPSTTSPGMVVTWIVVIVLMVGSIVLRIMV